jgi:aspartate/methionine/tyrosine aminotransferase
MRSPARFEFMHWAKQTVGRVPYCLGASGVPAVDPDRFPPAGAPYAEFNYYGNESIRAAVAAAQGVSADHVLISDGTSLANYTALTALAGPGDRVLVENPTYPILRQIPGFHGAAVELLERRPEAGWIPDPGDIAAAATRRGADPLRAVVLTRLHNPSGADLPREFLEELSRLADRHDFHVLIDEVFLDVLPDPVPAHRLSARFISTGSLTKVYGFGGLRCGWIIGNPETIAPMKEFSFYLAVDGAAGSQATGARVLAERAAFRESARRRAAAGRAVVESWIAGRTDVHWVPPVGGINGFIRLDGVRDTTAFARGLFETREVNVAPGEPFGSPGWIRISWGTDPSIVREALSRVGQALDEAKS